MRDELKLEVLKVMLEEVGYDYVSIVDPYMTWDNLFVREYITDKTGVPAFWAVVAQLDLAVGVGGRYSHPIKKVLPLGQYALTPKSKNMAPSSSG